MINNAIKANILKYVPVNLSHHPPLPPAKTVAVPADLPARRQGDRLPSTVAALAAIPEEEIWLQKQKSARTRRAYRRDPIASSALRGR